MVWPTGKDAGASPHFPPTLAIEVVKLACERPETAGRSLSQWDCLEIRRQIMNDGLVDSIGRESIRKFWLLISGNRGRFTPGCHPGCHGMKRFESGSKPSAISTRETSNRTKWCCAWAK